MTGPIDSAYVDIRPDLDRFAAQLKRQLDDAFGKLRAHLDRAGEDSGEKLGDGIVRGADGRLRDAKGRFVKAGDGGGKSYGLGFRRGFLGGLGGLFKPLGRQIPLIGAIGTMLGGQLVFSLKAAAVAGLASLAVDLAVALVPVVNALAAVGALLPAIGVAAVLPIATLAVAFGGMGDALKAGLAGDTEKLAEAMKKLAPAAQAVVKAIVALKPQAQALKQAVQQAFFTGLDVAVQRLAGVYLPQLQTTMVRVAASFNEMAKNVVAVLTTPEAIAGVNDSFDDMAKAIANVNRIVPGLVEGFGRLVRVGATFLPGLTGGFEQAGNTFAAFIARVEASGQLQTFIQNGLDTLAALGRAVGQVASLFASIGQAAKAAGFGLGGVIGGLLQDLTAFAKTAQGMASLTAVFAALASVGQSLGGALATILPVLGGVLTGLAPILATVVANLAPALAAAVQGIAPLLGLFGFMGPLSAVLATLVPLAAQVAEVLGTGLATAIGALLPGLAVLAGALTTSLQPVLPVIADLFAALAPSVGALFAALAQIAAPLLDVASTLLVTLTPALQVLAPLITVVAVVLNALAGPLRVVASFLRDNTAAVWLLTAAYTATIIVMNAMKIATLATHAVLIIIRAATMAWTAVNWILGLSLWAALGPIGLIVIGIVALIAAIVWIATKTTWFQDAWNASWGAIKTAFHATVGFLGNLFTTIGRFIVDAAEWFRSLPGRILTALAALPAQLRAAFLNAVNQVLYVVGYGIGTVIRFFLELPHRVGTALVGLAALLSGLFRTAWNLATVAVATGVAAVITFFTALPGRVWAAVSALPAIISNLFNTAMAFARNAVVAGVNAVVSFLASAPGRARTALAGIGDAVRSALSGAAGWLVDAGRNIIMGLINGIKGAVGAAVDAVKNAMGSVIKGAKNALGEKSESKVFAAIGADTVGGYIAGIRARIADATEAVAAMVLPPAAANTTAGHSAGTAAAAGFETPAGDSSSHAEPILVQVFIGEKELTDLVQVVVTDRDRALKRRVLAGSGTA